MRVDRNIVFMHHALGSVPVITLAILLVGALAARGRITITAQGGVHLGGVRFSGDIGDTDLPHLGTISPRSAGARARRDFVLLAGVSWRAN